MTYMLHKTTSVSYSLLFQPPLHITWVACITTCMSCITRLGICWVERYAHVIGHDIYVVNTFLLHSVTHILPRHRCRKVSHTCYHRPLYIFCLGHILGGSLRSCHRTRHICLYYIIYVADTLSPLFAPQFHSTRSICSVSSGPLL